MTLYRDQMGVWVTTVVGPYGLYYCVSLHFFSLNYNCLCLLMKVNLATFSPGEWFFIVKINSTAHMVCIIYFYSFSLGNIFWLLLSESEGEKTIYFQKYCRFLPLLIVNYSLVFYTHPLLEQHYIYPCSE